MTQACADEGGRVRAVLPSSAPFCNTSSRRPSLSSSDDSSRHDEDIGARIPVVAPGWQPSEPMDDLSPLWVERLPGPVAMHDDWGHDDSDEDGDGGDVDDALVEVLGGRSSHSFYRVPVHHKLSRQWPQWGSARRSMGDDTRIEEETHRSRYGCNEDMEGAAWLLMEEMLQDATPRTHKRIMQLV